MAVRDVAKSAIAAPPRTGIVNATLTPATRSVRAIGAAVPRHPVTFDTTIATQAQQRALNDAPQSDGRRHSVSEQRTTLGLSAARRSARLGPASGPPKEEAMKYMIEYTVRNAGLRYDQNLDNFEALL